MYEWRSLTAKQRQELLVWRKRQSRPWHSPPHRPSLSMSFHITAACYEHRPWIGHSGERMASFSEALLDTFDLAGAKTMAWCILPNHYHALIETTDVLAVLAEVGRLHGRTSFAWNGEEETRGRTVWFRAAERAMRSDRHYWATMNYVMHNPVHHGYVERWEEWPFSSAREYLERVGRDEAIRAWKEYPILDYGKGWDDAGW
ncbi:MAG: hypothetical protein ABIZ56_03020 [Chthoniobacteraceae bacterium]